MGTNYDPKGVSVFMVTLMTTQRDSGGFCAKLETIQTLTFKLARMQMVERSWRDCFEIQSFLYSSSMRGLSYFGHVTTSSRAVVVQCLLLLLPRYLVIKPNLTSTSKVVEPNG